MPVPPREVDDNDCAAVNTPIFLVSISLSVYLSKQKKEIRKKKKKKGRKSQISFHSSHLVSSHLTPISSHLISFDLIYLILSTLILI